MNDLAVIQADIEKSLIASGVQSVLPDHIKMTTFVRCAATAMATSNDLAEADRDTLIMALTKCATDGLMPDGREAAIVTFNTNTGTKQQPVWVKKAQYMPMIDGVLKRARMSGQISVMTSKAVFENDHFDYWIDEMGEHIKYRPSFTGRGDFKLAFAFAKLTTGDLIVEVMTKEDVDKVRGASKTSAYGPWKDWYDRMACKAVFHRLARRLPNASEIIEMCEAGMNMNFDKNTEKDITPGSQQVEVLAKPTLTPENTTKWESAITAFKRDGDLKKVLERVSISDEHQMKLVYEANDQMEQEAKERQVEESSVNV